jgi:hypothetical protein
MSLVPYIAVFSLVAVAVVEAVVYMGMKGEHPLASRRAQPE